MGRHAASDDGVRMEPIAVLPIFFKLRDKPVILTGGGLPAVWKAELLVAAGARVTLLAADPCDELVAFAQAAPAGSVELERRAWTAADLVGAAMALGAIEDDEEAARFRAAAKAAGVPVNVIDKPAFCDFQFGTVVSRSPLVIGISTDGAAPVFGQAIRARIEALLPAGMKAWAEAARDWRPAVQARGFDLRGRRRFWEVFAEKALEGTGEAPSDLDRLACMQAAVATVTPVAAVTITLVCAGRGRPDGITLAAIKALQDADEVFYGPDVPPTLVSFARRESLKVMVPRDEPDKEAALVLAKGSGRRRVWLDAGNPEKCQRWRERASALASSTEVIGVAGLGRCEACTPACPAWSSNQMHPIKPPP